MDNLQHGFQVDELASAPPVHQPAIIKFFSWVFSYIFHPLFIPLYVTYYLAFLDSHYFNGITNTEKNWVLLRVAINMVFFPAVSVLLLKGVGFINSIFLRTQRERIIPYIISNIFFFWMFLVFRNQPEVPSILTTFVLGVFLSSSIAISANIYFKISMHAIGVGGLCGLMLVILYSNAAGADTLPFATAILISGIVCTARMLISNHTQRDIYFGFFLGMLCQIVSAYFIM